MNTKTAYILLSRDIFECFGGVFSQFSGVKFGIKIFCLCKRNDKYQVCDNDDNAVVMEINLIFFVTLLMMMLLMLLKMTMLTLLTMMLVNMKRTFQRRASLLLQSRALQIQLKIFLVIEIKYK